MECQTCGRTMRWARQKDRPGTVAHTTDECGACHKRRRRLETGVTKTSKPRVMSAEAVETSSVGEVIELCRWVPAGETWRAVLVKGRVVAHHPVAWRIEVDGHVRSYPRTEWMEVAA